MPLVPYEIPNRKGVKYAFHVLTPALVHRLANPADELPVMALRDEKTGYTVARLYERIEILGPSVMEPLFHDPLPGTGKRGVAICFTHGGLRCWRPDWLPAPRLDTARFETPDTMLQSLLTHYRKYAKRVQP